VSFPFSLHPSPHILEIPEFFLLSTTQFLHALLTSSAFRFVAPTTRVLLYILGVPVYAPPVAFFSRLIPTGNDLGGSSTPPPPLVSSPLRKFADGVGEIFFLFPHPLRLFPRKRPGTRTNAMISQSSPAYFFCEKSFDPAFLFPNLRTRV